MRIFVIFDKQGSFRRNNSNIFAFSDTFQNFLFLVNKGSLKEIILILFGFY